MSINKKKIIPYLIAITAGSPVHSKVRSDFAEVRASQLEKLSKSLVDLYEPRRSEPRPWSLILDMTRAITGGTRPDVIHATKVGTSILGANEAISVGTEKAVLETVFETLIKADDICTVRTNTHALQNRFGDCVVDLTCRSLRSYSKLSQDKLAIACSVD